MKRKIHKNTSHSVNDERKAKDAITEMSESIISWSQFYGNVWMDQMVFIPFSVEIVTKVNKSQRDSIANRSRKKHAIIKES